MNTRECPECGNGLAQDASFCPKCGANLDELYVVDAAPAAPAFEPPVARSHAEPAVHVPPVPHLVMDASARARVGTHGVLWFGLANPSDVPLACRLLVEVERSALESFVHFNGEREVRVAPNSEATASVSFRAKDAGMFPLSVRLLVEDERAHGHARFFRVPNRCRVFFGVAADREGGAITIQNSVNVERNYGGDIDLRAAEMSPEALRRLRAQMDPGGGDHEAQPIELPLRPPSDVLGWLPFLPGALRRDHYCLDLSRAGRLERRVHLLARDEICFGRNDQTRLADGTEAANTVAWRWLPCRSKELDADNFRRNMSISRFRAGVLRADAEGTVVTAGKGGFRWDGLRVEGEEQRALRTSASARLGLGEPPLELTLTALRQRGEDALRWLQLARHCGDWTGPIAPKPRHDAIRIERPGNFQQVSYLVLLASASVGGGAWDAIRVDGLPPSLLRFARCGAEVFFLLKPPAGREGTFQDEGLLWRPAVGRVSWSWEDWSLSLRPSSVAESKSEEDLVEGGIPT